MRHLIIVTALAVISLAACSDSNPVEVANNTGSNTEDAVDTNPVDSDDTESGGDSDSDGDTDQGGGNTPPPPTENSARYRITFNATWSAETHPLRFPGNPHFAGLVGAVHNEQVRFWAPGQLATDGIEVMAETGNKADLLAEVDTAIDNGYAGRAISGPGIATSPDSVSVVVDVSRAYPEITVVTTVAPSPDWFVGVRNVSMLQNGVFANRMAVDLAVYDAGTDNGARYVSSSDDTTGPEPISRLTSQPDDSPFVNGLPVVGQMVFEKL